MTTIQAALRKIIVDNFSTEDLTLLCTDTGIDPDKVPGRDKGKEFYLGEIINYAQRRGLLDAFVKQVKAARPHLQLDLFSLDAASISGWLYGDAHLEIDRKLFQEIRTQLGKSMKLIRDQDFAMLFDLYELESIRPFLCSSNDPEAEFIDPHMQDSLVVFTNRVDDFFLIAHYEVYRYFFFNDLIPQDTGFDPCKRDSSALVLAEFSLSQQQRLDRSELWRQKSIRTLRFEAEKLWFSYYTFVQEGRRQLGVA